MQIITSSDRPQRGETIVFTDDIGSIGTIVEVQYVTIFVTVTGRTQERYRSVLPVGSIEQTIQYSS